MWNKSKLGRHAPKLTEWEVSGKTHPCQCRDPTAPAKIYTQPPQIFSGVLFKAQDETKSIILGADHFLVNS